MIAHYSIHLLKFSMKFFLDLDGSLVDHLLRQGVGGANVVKAELTGAFHSMGKETWDTAERLIDKFQA